MSSTAREEIARLGLCIRGRILDLLQQFPDAGQ
jgi:hypothetical protein